jgi:putative photosynthetic complex assembly protein
MALPRPSAPLLIGAAMAAALAAAVAGELTGSGTAYPTARPELTRDLAFADQADGSVLITDAGTGRVVEVATGENGFLRGTLRGFARERRRDGVDMAAPFRLTGWTDKRLTLEDPATGRHTDLEAFGSANVAVFVRLLTEPERSTP